MENNNFLPNNIDPKEEEQKRKERNATLIIVIVALTTLMICFIASCCAGGFYLFSQSDKANVTEKVINRSESKTPESIPVTVTPPEAISATKTPENNPAPQESTPNELTKTQKKILQRAEEIRGLSMKEPLAPVYQTREELRSFLINKSFESVTDEEFIQDRDLLALLGFVDPKMDLKKFYLDFYTDQIAGFFDDETGTMYLVEGGTEKENSLTLAHEYIHALQYDNFDLANSLNYTDEYCKDHSEFCLALEAVMEGDAMLTENLLSKETDFDLTNEPESENNSKIFEQAPKYFQESLLFPYTSGFDFVFAQYFKGGFHAVDELYKNPPVSAEQILHPSRYPHDIPIQVDIEPFASKIESKCKLINADTLNESDLLWVMTSSIQKKWRLSDVTASIAAEGWGGGRYQYAYCNGQPMFFGKTVWDSKKEADEFYQAMQNYHNLRWGSAKKAGFWEKDGQRSDLIQQDDIVFWIIAPEGFDTAFLLDIINSGRQL